MLCENKIIALYCIVNDMRKEMHHYEDSRVRIRDSEVITTAFVSVLCFGGHLDNSRHFRQMKGYVPLMLDKSRFCRRLHRLSDFLLRLFSLLGKRLKAMRRYFYGIKVQVMTLDGIPVEFCLVPGSEHDSQALGKLPFDVAPESSIYMDAGYTDYGSEDDLLEAELIYAMVQRKSNSKRKDEPHINFLQEYRRKETDFSLIKVKMLRSIHAVTKQGFLLKVALFVIAFAFDKIP